MKKTTRNIIIMLAVLAILGGGLALLLLLPGESAEAPESSQSPAEESSASSEAVSVMARSMSEVESVLMKDAGGEYRFVGDGEDGFTIEGCEDYPLLSGSINSSVNSLLTIHALRDLGSPDNLKDFGLDGEDAVTAEISYKDGGKDTLVLGNAASETAARYLLKDGTVYLVSTLAEALYGGKYGYFSAGLYTVPDRTAEDGEEDGSALTDILYHLRLSGENFPEPVEIVYDNSVLNTYLMRSPMTAESGTALLLDEIIPGLKAPVSAGVEAAGLTDELLARYGLDQPAAVAEFDLNNSAHTLSVSKAENGVRYLLLDDRDMVYRVSDAAVSCWAEATPMTLRMTYVWLANIMDVKELRVFAGGEDYRFTVRKELDEEKSTEDDPTYVLFPSNGSIDIDYANYQTFFKEMLVIAVLNTERPEYGGEPDIFVEYHYFDADEVNTVAYYAVGEDRYVVELNGGFNGQVRRAEVDKVFSYLPALNRNEAKE